jgi:transposase
VRAEAQVDGKFLLRSSDPTLSAEDIALGYKQLLQVERGWRDMKTTLDPRPVHHRKQERIREHVQLCWLALLLIRVAENHTDDTWRNARRELQRLHMGTFRGNAGVVRKTSQATTAQLRILHALGLQAPPAFPTLDPAA